MTAVDFRIPLPPGATKPYKSPRPHLCWECEGCGVGADGACPLCEGRGVMSRADFNLPPGRAHNLRHVAYVPVPRCRGGAASGLLTVSVAVNEDRRRSVSSYQVVEFDCDGPNRGFHVWKAGDEDRKHEVTVGPDGCTCSCEGETYLTSAKFNQKAWEAGEEVFPSYGCRHLDSLVALINGGWMEL